jgi:hypothetical protein
MAITPRDGAVKSQDLPFSLGDRHAAATGTVEISKLLGTTFELEDGLHAILVEAGAAQASPAKLCFKWSDTVARKVVITAATGNRAVGVAHPNLEDLALGDLFFLLRGVAGSGRVSGISAAAIVAGAILQPTTGGKLVTDAAYEQHVSIGPALHATAAVDLDVEVQIIDEMPGAFV